MAQGVRGFTVGTGDPCVFAEPGMSGDYLVCAVLGEGGTSWTPPDATWHKIADDNDGGTLGLFGVSVWWKQSAVGSGSYSFNTNVSNNTGVMAAFTGVGTGAPTISSSGIIRQGDPWNITSPAVSCQPAVLALAIAVVALVTSGGTDTWTNPSGYSALGSAGVAGAAINFANATTTGILQALATTLDTRGGSSDGDQIGYQVALPLLAPTINTQPLSQPVPPGAATTFSVSATASAGSLTYQWLKNGSSITGATSSSYTTPILLLSGNQDVYSCQVTDSNGTATTAGAAITISAPLFQFLSPMVLAQLLAGASTPGFYTDSIWTAPRLPARSLFQSGEPLGAIAVPSPITPGGGDTAATFRVFEPPQQYSFESPPPRVFTATGIEHSEPSARPQPGTPRYLAAEPLPAAKFPPSPVDLPWAAGRVTRRPVAVPGGEPNPPSVSPPTSYETATAPRRSDLGPPRHLPADALPLIAGSVAPGTLTDATPAAARVTARAPAAGGDTPAARTPAAGFDPATPGIRLPVRPQPESSNPPAPSVFTATGTEHAEPTARLQSGPPRHVSGEPVPPQVAAPTGFEHSEPTARPRPGPPRYVAGDPLPAAEFVQSGYDVAWSRGRVVPRPNQSPGGEPETPGVFTATSFETAPAPRRPDLGPPRHASGEPTPPQMAPGAGIDTTPALARAPARVTVTTGGVILPVTPVGGFDTTAAASRPALRGAPAGGGGNPPSVFTATGFETTPPGSRPQLGPPRQLPGEPLRAPVEPVLVRGGDVSPATSRLTLPPPPASGQVVTPSVFAPTGFETTPPWTRPRAESPRHVSSDPPVTRPVRSAGVENPAAGQRRPARAPDQSSSSWPGAIGPPVDSVIVRGRVFVLVQTFGGEAFTTPVWTAPADVAPAQRRQEQSRHMSGEPAATQAAQASGFEYKEPPRPRAQPPVHQAGEPVSTAVVPAVTDGAWATARAQLVRVPPVSEAWVTRETPLGAFVYTEPATRRPARQPLWIDSNGLPAPRIQPPTLQTPRDFEVELSVPLQLPAQFLVSLPAVLQTPSQLSVELPGLLALPADFTIALAVAPMVPSAFEVALPRGLGIPSGFRTAENL